MSTEVCDIMGSEIVSRATRGLVERYNRGRERAGLNRIGPRKQRHYRSLLGYVGAGGILILILTAIFAFFPSAVLSLVSLTLAILSISLAIFSFTQPEYWYPRDLEHLIKSTEPDEWEYQEIDEESRTQFVYKNNRDIVLKLQPYREREDFHEEWVENYADNTAYKRQLEVTHRGRRLDNVYIVSVDGGRDDIPIPSRFDRTLSEYEYELGRILNCAQAEHLARDLEDYDREYHQALKHGGISAENDSFEINWDKATL